MKVTTLLAHAAKCNSDDAAQTLLDKMETAFGRTKALGNFSSINSEAYIEAENKPYIHFELNHVISDHYITMIRPEIRDGEFVVVVKLNHMLDGRGTSSQSWEVFKDLEAVIEASDDHTVAELANLAKAKAIEYHAELLETVGIKSEVAKTAAKRSW